MVLNFFRSGLKNVKDALSKTRKRLGEGLRNIFSGRKIDADVLEDLEQLLYEADLGVKTAEELTEKVEEFHRENPECTTDALIAFIKGEILELLQSVPSDFCDVPQTDGPTIALIVGVNGNGKTTSVAKLAKLFKGEGKKVLLGAADTFRAAAMDQLTHWAEKAGTEIVKGQPKSDPSAVVFDTVTAAKARGSDLALIDTAGRLHAKRDLMQELEKMRRSCKKVLPDSPHETLLVLDATTGQNAIDQAKTFNEYTPITGLILTKLDGTAKGGIVVPICRELKIPIKFIGTGEGIDDLQPFDAEAFVNGIFD